MACLRKVPIRQNKEIFRDTEQARPHLMNFSEVPKLLRKGVGLPSQRLAPAFICLQSKLPISRLFLQTRRFPPLLKRSDMPPIRPVGVTDDRPCGVVELGFVPP